MSLVWVRGQPSDALVGRPDGQGRRCALSPTLQLGAIPKSDGLRILAIDLHSGALAHQVKSSESGIPCATPRGRS
jgi:hypothetical protein